jgi:hypothetical protein
LRYILIILSIIFSFTVYSCSSKDESTTDTASTLIEITAVTTPTNDSTPDYTFYSSTAGTITYGGSCSSSTTSAVSGNNTITLNTLSLGTYSDCTVTVTDSASNSVTLNMSSIVVIPSYVAVGDSGTILTSSNVTSWTSKTSSTTNKL